MEHMVRVMVRTVADNKEVNLLNYSGYSSFSCPSREEWSNV